MTIAVGRFRQRAGHSGTPVGVRYCSSGRFLVSADQSGEIIVWPLSRFSFSRSVTTPYSPLTGFWFSEDEQWLLAGCQAGHLLIYSLPKLRLESEVHLKPDDPERSPVLSGVARPILDWVVLALAPSGDPNLHAVLEFRDFFAIRREGWQVSKWQHLTGTLLEYTAASPGGQKVFFGDELGCVYRYEPREMRLELFAEHREQVRGIDVRNMQPTIVDSAAGIAALALSPDGAFVASTSRAGGVQVWDAKVQPGQPDVLSRSKRLPCAVRKPAKSVWLRALCFMANTGAVAIGGDDGVVEIWEPRSNRALFRAEFPEGIRGLAASPGGSELAVACQDGALYLLPNKVLGLG